MNTSSGNLSLRAAALIAGFGLLIMAIAAPFAEIYALPKLIAPGSDLDTARAVIANRSLLVGAILCYLITFIMDVVVAWALYALLRPVNALGSLLAALFRLVYAVIAIVALLNLITVLRQADALGGVLDPSRIEPLTQISSAFAAFKTYFHFGILFFGLHLLLLGGVVMAASYVPKVLGPLLIISGAGYLLSALEPVLLQNSNLDVAKYTFVGEVIFMLWLLLRGWKLKG